MIKFSLRNTLLIGTAVRLMLMPFTAHPFDVYAWYIACMDVLERGFDFSVLYSARPLWDLTLSLLAYVYMALSSLTGWKATAVSALPAAYNPYYNIEWVPGPLFNVVVKTPIVLADLGGALVLHRLVSRFSSTGSPEFVAALYYLNPFLIWVSSGWGQYDAIPSFLTILSLYLLLVDRIMPSAFSLLLATLFKVYPAAFLVPVSIYLFKKGEREKLTKYLLVFVLPFLVYLGSSGFQAVNQFTTLFFNLFFSRWDFHGVFGFGLTYWSWSLVYPLDPNIWTPVSLVLIAALLGVSLYSLLKMNFDDPLERLTMAACLVAAPFFLGSRLVSETRLVWLLPFLAILVGKQRMSIKPFGFISLTAFLYTQKNFPYYLLPLATVNKNILSFWFNIATPFRDVVQDALLPSSVGAIILASLGTLFSILLLSMYFKWVKAAIRETSHEYFTS